MIQAKLTIDRADSPLEREADNVADQIMRMPEATASRVQSPGVVQRKCAACEEEEKRLQRRESSLATPTATSEMESKVDSLRGAGQPLPDSARGFFEPRFGRDFSHVRIHTNGSADSAARAVGALAYARGGDIVFRAGLYQPDSDSGRRLLAHELTHVVQQSAAPAFPDRPARRQGATSPLSITAGFGHAAGIQRALPGDGLEPPGICTWAKYLILRGPVESAKTIVDALGGCKRGDSCLLLATKMAAFSAEITARAALDATCFKGGNSGHTEQIKRKVEALQNCAKEFWRSNCPDEMVDAMSVVVEQARRIIEAAAVGALVVAAVVALIAAVMALVELIIAAGAAVAGAAASSAVVAGATAVMAVLLHLLDQFTSEEPGEA